MGTTEKNILVFDIGKTHVKITVLNNAGLELYKTRTSNRTRPTEPYHSYDVDGIWAWFKHELSALASRFDIRAISIATHGAAAALIDKSNGQLILPIMDYEFDAYPDDLPDYESLRPPFEQTGSPHFPAGLNLGRQLSWQSLLITKDTKDRAVILMYPQYWAWKLSGQFATEITSLGCHTDLWNYTTQTPSALLEKLGLKGALPPLTDAWNPIGKIKNCLAKELGINSDCDIYPGVHDSNAGYVPILKVPKNTRPTVVSTGTWSVIMDPTSDCKSLDASKDMLVNIDAEHSPLATARYMGGREFGLICERLNTDIATTFTDKDIGKIISSAIFIMPSFCSGTGPYSDMVGGIISDEECFKINGKAAATIYSALMVNDIIKRLNPSSKQDILIEGSFAANEVLCGLLATLNPDRTVRVQNGGNGVTEGCFLLTQWNTSPSQAENPEVKAYYLESFFEYAQVWKEKLPD